MKTFDYEKYIKFTWDSKILSYLSAIHELKGIQKNLLNQRPVVLDRLVKIAKIQSVVASNKIEGIITTDTRIKQLCEDKITPRNHDEEEIKGYREVLSLIHESYADIPLSKNYILQLHKILFSFSTRSIGGKFKNSQNYISEIDTHGNTFIRFTPLEPHLTPDAIDSICQNYNSVIEKESLDPLLLIPIFIHDFLCIHPFNDGNGRMSRLLTTLLLYRSGFLVGRYISLENKIEKTKDYYYEALGASSNGWHDDTNDPIPFIKYILGIILASYRDLEDRINLLEPKTKSLDKVRRATETLIGKFTKADVLALCSSLERSSVAAALKQLVEEGELKRYGTGKATYYVRIK